MKIVHVHDLASVASGLAAGQRTLGHEATVISETSPYVDRPDLVLPEGKNLVLDQRALWKHRQQLYRADVIHLHGGIWRSQLIWLYFRARCRRTAFVIHLHGSEARPHEGGKGAHYLWTAEHLFCSTPELRRYVPRAEWLPSPVPIPAEAPLSTNPKPLIGHFPTDRGIKGTDHVLAAFEALGEPDASAPEPGMTRLENDRAVLLVIEQLPHARALEIMDRCDLVIDQINSLGIYSVVSIEGMARGKVVVSSYDQALYPESVPIVRIDQGTAAREIERLLDTPEDFAELGRAGRAYAERVHEPTRVAARTIEVYTRLLDRIAR